MSLENIRRILKKSKSKIENLFDVKELGIFGSYVRGEQKKNSDLDVLVEFNAVPGLIKFIKLENYLATLVKMKVDLVRKKAIRQELKGSILKEAVSVW